MPRESCGGCFARSIPASTLIRTESACGPGSKLARCDPSRGRAPDGRALCRDRGRLPRSGDRQPATVKARPGTHSGRAQRLGGRRDGKVGGLSSRTRRHIHRILSTALARAVEQQLVARNACDPLRKRLPKVEHQEMAPLSAEQTQRLLDAIRHTRIYWPALIALATGMRRGEILALRWRNVDLDRGNLRVVESLEQTKAGLRAKAQRAKRRGRSPCRRSRSRNCAV